MYVHFFKNIASIIIHKAHNFHLRRVKLIRLLVDAQSTDFTFQVICSNSIFKIFHKSYESAFVAFNEGAVVRIRTRQLQLIDNKSG